MSEVLQENKKGTLYLCATPIGNLEDITFRVVRILREADLIAAEDTRQTMKLLNHFDIHTPMTSYYEHNKIEKGKLLIQKLLEGQSIALVSDAGTPGISDPGEDLVKNAIEHGIQVTMAPGPAAAVMGVVLSGLPSGRFVFEGFLPMNKRARKERLKEIKNEARTMVFYEAPHKLKYTLDDLYENLGNRKIALARELTKKFEEIIRCDLEAAIEKYKNQPPKGEYVIILDGLGEMARQQLKEENPWDKLSIHDHVDKYINEGMSKKEAMKRVAEDRGISKREVYGILLEE